MFKYGIEPLVTMFHLRYTLAALDERGSCNPEIIDWLVNFCKLCMKNYGDRVKYWQRSNETKYADFSWTGIGTLHFAGRMHKRNQRNLSIQTIICW